MEWPLEVVKSKFFYTDEALKILGLQSNEIIKTYGAKYIENRFELKDGSLKELFSSGKDYNDTGSHNKHRLMSVELFVCLLFGGLPELKRVQSSLSLEHVRAKVIRNILQDCRGVISANKSLQDQEVDEPVVVNLDPRTVAVSCLSDSDEEVTDDSLSDKEYTPPLQGTPKGKQGDDASVSVQKPTGACHNSHEVFLDTDSEITYHRFENGTHQGRPKLFDSQGYYYCMQKEYQNHIVWQCTVGKRSTMCKATLFQSGKTFKAGLHPHNHEGNPSKLTAVLEGLRIIKERDLSITYHRVEQGSLQGRPKLYDSLGYNYNINGITRGVIHWQCSIRPKENPCKATVIEREGEFLPGLHNHNHGRPLHMDYPERDTNVSYNLVKEGTRNGKPKLFDNKGFTYTVSRIRNGNNYWKCTSRAVNHACKATVIQLGETFRPGIQPHNHGPVKKRAKTHQVHVTKASTCDEQNKTY